MLSKKCIILAGGELDRPEVLKDSLNWNEYMIAADGGLLHADVLGIWPDKVIGDFDSVTVADINRFFSFDIAIERFPTEKDESDTLIALRDAVNNGYANIDVWGALGGRFDHSVANMMLLFNPITEKANVKIVTWNQVVFAPKKRQVIFGNKGDIISLFPIGGDITGLKMEGLKYQARDGVLLTGDALGLSNEMTKNWCVLDWEQGRLLCVHTYK